MMNNTQVLNESLETCHLDSRLDSKACCDAGLDKAVQEHAAFGRGRQTCEESTIRELLEREGPGSLMNDIRNARDLDEVEQQQFDRERIRLRGK